MIYDLIVLGNGIAAQTFLFELFNSSLANVNNSQNYSVAQIFADEISPPCSLKTTATVALSGIDEGVSPLGDELSSSYYLFEEFFKKHAPKGVKPIIQSIVFTNERDEQKLIRRYENLIEINDPLFKDKRRGVLMDSFQITPLELKAWFEDYLNKQSLKRIQQFVKSVEKNDQGHFVCHLLNGVNFVAKKIVLATGAYSKIFSTFFNSQFSNTEEMNETEILAGSYLERTVDFKRPSFFISMDGHKCVYRAEENKLVIGSVSEKGAFLLGDFAGLSKILKLFNDNLSFSIGEPQDFKLHTGLRHKGKKRRPIFRALDEEKKIFMISGMYKNGFTFSHLAAREVLKELF